MLYEKFYSNLQPDLVVVKGPHLPPRSGKDLFENSYNKMEKEYSTKETILNKHLLYELSKVTSVPGGIDIMGTKKLPSRRGYGGFFTKPA